MTECPVCCRGVTVTNGVIGYHDMRPPLRALCPASKRRLCVVTDRQRAARIVTMVVRWYALDEDDVGDDTALAVAESYGQLLDDVAAIIGRDAGAKVKQ